MARKTKSGRHQLNLYEELKDVLREVQDELLEKREIALDKASDYFLEKVEQATPVKTGKLRDSWLRTYKYKGVRYVGNSADSKTLNSSGSYYIPLANLVEFSKNGKPFIRRTFEENKSEIISIIKEELK